MERAVFIDRDNTLIENDGDLGDPEHVRLIGGVAAGLRALREAGYRLIVVTNQAGVARGKFSESDVDAVHQRIASLVDGAAGSTHLIDRFYYCPYHPEATVEAYRRDHHWRKPNPGMLFQAAHDLELDLPRSWMIGDQQRDISAGRTARCRTILITDDEQLARETHPTATARGFNEAVQYILDHPPNGPDERQNTSAGETPAGLSNRTQTGFGQLHRSILELTEEIRSERLRRTEFTYLRMGALICQLLVVLLAVLGLLQLASADTFMKWMIGALLAQLLTITLILLDLKG